MFDHVGVVDVARLVIAATLLLAGGSKLFAPRTLARGLSQISGGSGEAGPLFTAAARGVAVVELTAALLLAGGWNLPIAALLAGAVGAGIAVFTATGLVLRRRPSCGCFGADSGRPVGPVNLVAGLAIVAGAVLVGTAPGGGGDPAGWLLLTSLGGLTVVLLRRRAALAHPFGRHFRIFAEAPAARELNQPS